MRIFRDWDFVGVDNFYQLGRALYKSTGVWIQAVLPDSTEVYYRDDRAEHIKAYSPIAFIKVGSIVEGGQESVSAVTVSDPLDLEAVIDHVAEEANMLWNEVNDESPI